MTAESGGTTVLGKQVSDLQSGVTVGTSAITGTLLYNEGWESGPLEGPGYYMALKFTASDWEAYDTAKVGLDPSEGTGLVDILSDPDKNGVFKITDKSEQKFVLEARKGAVTIHKEWSLNGLNLRLPDHSDIFEITDCEDQTGFYDSSGQRQHITQTIESFVDDTVVETGEYTGTIIGTLNQAQGTMYMPVKDAVKTYLASLVPSEGNLSAYYIKTIGYDDSDNAIYTDTYSFGSTGEKLPNAAIRVAKSGSSVTKVEVSLYVKYTSGGFHDTDSIKITYDVSELVTTF